MQVGLFFNHPDYGCGKIIKVATDGLAHVMFESGLKKFDARELPKILYKNKLSVPPSNEVGTTKAPNNAPVNRVVNPSGIAKSERRKQVLKRQDLQREIKLLLEDGQETEAERVYEVASMEAWWPNEEFKASKLKARRKSKDQVWAAIRDDKIEYAFDIYEQKCKQWWGKDDFQREVEDFRFDYYFEQGRFQDALNIKDLDSAALAIFSKKALSQRVISFDLETEGQEITEIGVAGCGEMPRLLFSTRSPAEFASLEEAIDKVIDLLSTSAVVVGHNISNWDIPILRRYRSDLEDPVLIWDTLYFGFVMDPTRHSYALNSTHVASEDALDALELFFSQLSKDCLRIILGQENHHDATLRSLAAGLSVNWKEPPIWLTNELRVRNSRPESIVIPKSRFRDCYWAKGLKFVGGSAIAAESFLSAASLVNKPSIALVAIERLVQQALEDHVQVLPEAIPLWLRDHPEVVACLKESKEIDFGMQGAIQVRGYPFSVAEWVELNDLGALSFVTAHGEIELSRRYLARPDEPIIISSIRSEECYQNAGINWIEWVREDAVAWKLGEPNRATQTWISGVWKSDDLNIALIKPEVNKSVVTAFAWTQPLLYPNSPDQHLYWTETIQRFLAARTEVKVLMDGTCFLVVCSSSSKKLIGLINEILSSLGLSPPLVEGWSRSRRIAAALATKSGCIAIGFDEIDEWVSIALTHDAGVNLVFECLIDRLPTIVSTTPGNVFGHGGDITAGLPQEIETFLKKIRVEHSRVCIIDPRISTKHASRTIEYKYACTTAIGEPELSRIQVSLRELGAIDRREPPDNIEALRTFFRKHWGKEDFRGPQEDAITTISSRNNDVIVRLPTGMGKSILFQVPSLFRGRFNRKLTLVICPLRALMHDQVEALRRLPAMPSFDSDVEYMSGDMSPHEIDEILQGIIGHRILMLYVAPERLRNPRFVQFIERRAFLDGGLECVVFDEAHCITQWGYEFRPDYLWAFSRINRDKRLLTGSSSTPFVFLSATLTGISNNYLEQICNSNFPKPPSFSPKIAPEPLQDHIQLHQLDVREPIALDDRRKHLNVEGARMEAILNVIKKAEATREIGANRNVKSAVLIFTTSRTFTDQLTSALVEKLNGSSEVSAFHAGMSADDRMQTLERYRTGDIHVLVSTKAFGMGMDIGHIHYVLHLSPPTYLEDYLQEVGRIGRDKDIREKVGLLSVPALLLHSQSDFEFLREAVVRSMVTWADLQELLRGIKALGATCEKRKLALLPDVGLKQPDTIAKARSARGATRKKLYWLERSNAIRVLEVKPNMLQCEINLDAVRGNICQSGLPAGELISAVLDMAEANGVLEPGLEPVGMLIEDAKNKKWVRAVIDTKILATRVGVESIARLFPLLVDPDVMQVVRVDSTLEFKLSNEGHWFKWSEVRDWLKHQSEELIKRAAMDGGFVLENDYFIGSPNVVFNSPSETQIINGSQRIGWALMSLMRFAGVSDFNVASANVNVMERRFEIARSKRFSASSKAKDLLILADIIFTIGENLNGIGNEGSVKLETLLKEWKGRPERLSIRTIRAACDLLTKLNIYRFHKQLPFDPVYLLEVMDQVELESEGQHHGLRVELETVNGLAPQRLDAMEILAGMPNDQLLKRAFIQGYFDIRTPDELQIYLEKSLSDLDAANLSERLAKILEGIQTNAVAEHFKRYNREDAASPNQWRAIQIPHEQSAIVNAGPGAGKTAVLVARIVHLIHVQGLRPEQILVLAFNRAVVFEIKKRVYEVFNNLGYGAYVRRLRVRTFHSIAVQVMGRDNHADGDPLTRLADHFRLHPADVSLIAGLAQTILVDEFQDMNDAIFGILQTLSKKNQASVFAIGDDDQDILGWTQNNRPPAAQYFNVFEEIFNVATENRFFLDVNFRSGKEIVDASNGLLSRFFNGQLRLKGADLRAAPCSVGAIVIRNTNVIVTDEYKRSIFDLIKRAETKRQSVAILCRTNQEVKKWHHLIQDCMDVTSPVTILGTAFNPDLSQSRHVGSFLDVARLFQRNRLMTQNLFEEMFSKWKLLDIYEARHGGRIVDQIHAMWKIFKEGQRHVYVTEFIRYAEDLKLDEFDRLSSALAEHAGNNQESTIVISTIHKVKGLEFDSVVIPPSLSPFPFGGNVRNIDLVAAEEARLFYVAMTRAKHELHFSWGDRERSWFDKRKFDGPLAALENATLDGSAADFMLSWAFRNDQLQDRIAKLVGIGDVVQVEESGHISHEVCGQIGKLSARGFRKLGPGMNARVCHVVRFPWNPEYQATDAVQTRGWGYSVLIENV